MNKIGIGQDSHRFLDGNHKPFILGGVTIPNCVGVEANSDGDVVLHSLCNALSSAIGGDSISTWFDARVKKGIVDSQEAVKVVYEKIKKEHYFVANVSIAVEAKRPYIQLETTDQMKANIAQLLELNKNQVGITYTSGEGLTPFGQGLGLQCICMVLLSHDNN